MDYKHPRDEVATRVFLPVTGKQVGYRICHLLPLIECGYSYRKLCRASRKLLADSVWGKQGKFQTYGKSQKNSQDGSNKITFLVSFFFLVDNMWDNQLFQQFPLILKLRFSGKKTLLSIWISLNR
jgi:hypothetical protein